MLRLISGHAANAEGQERIFNNIKRITKNTSNYHHGQIIPNLFIRLQAEREMGLHEDEISHQEAQISKLSTCLPESKNTRIPLATVRKYSREWQAHLQNISDFLLEGEGVWWNKDDEAVEFNDITNHPSQQASGPELHHFRSTTLKDEATNRKHCWKSCLDHQISIPIHLIRIDQANGSTYRLYTDYLGDEIPEVERQNEDQQHPQLAEENLDNTGEILEEDQENGEENMIIEISPAADEIIDFQEPDIPLPLQSSEKVTATDKGDNHNATDSHITQLNTQHGITLEVSQHQNEIPSREKFYT